MEDCLIFLEKCVCHEISSTVKISFHSLLFSASNGLDPTSVLANV